MKWLRQQKNSHLHRPPRADRRASYVPRRTLASPVRDDRSGDVRVQSGRSKTTLHNPRANRVAQDVHRGAKAIEQPVQRLDCRSDLLQRVRKHFKDDQLDEAQYEMLTKLIQQELPEGA